MNDEIKLKKKSIGKRAGKVDDVQHNVAQEETIKTYLQYVAGVSVELMEEIVKLGKEAYEILKPVAEGKKPSELLLDILAFWHTYKDKIKEIEEELSRLKVENALLRKYIKELEDKRNLDLEKLRLTLIIYTIGMIKGIRPELIEEYLNRALKEAISEEDIEKKNIKLKIYDIILASLITGKFDEIKDKLSEIGKFIKM